MPPRLTIPTTEGVAANVFARHSIVQTFAVPDGSNLAWTCSSACSTNFESRSSGLSRSQTPTFARHSFQFLPKTSRSVCEPQIVQLKFGMKWLFTIYCHASHFSAKAPKRALFKAPFVHIWSRFGRGNPWKLSSKPQNLTQNS